MEYARMNLTPSIRVCEALGSLSEHVTRVTMH